MKFLLIFCGCVLVVLSEHTVYGRNLNWQQKMQSDMERMQQEMEAQQKHMQAQAHKIQHEAKAQQNHFNDQLQLIKQKCAQKGLNNDISSDISQNRGQNGQSTRSVNRIAQMVNGFQHIYEQTIDPATNKVDGRYYGFDSRNPNAEPICGLLTFN